ncbi:MAG TPA: Gfo/Idh/MocA family oxidoreductase [Aggregatilineales bacterium]|nr:Gfo/Idh/MocA family oxidoreductase [Aggregatilineales bacterium]
MVLLPTPIGIIGCGNISTIYIENSKRLSNILLKGCADLDRSRAEAQVARFGLSKVYTVEEMLADPEIELIINLTIPAAHGDVALAAVQAGKSVYNEKPLTIKLEDAQRLMALAEAKGVRVGAAPDTFLGAGLQTCRQVIDSGEIGVPVAATAFMLGHGPEGWHPSPEFFYQVGGGPMFDMGPYYLTALVSLLGPVRRVTGATRISFPQRTITSQPNAGKVMNVEIPTHVTGLLDFASGPVATIVTSFDVWAAEVPRIEIYGSEGTLSLPDPNTFAGPVRVRRQGESQWREVPLSAPFPQNSRGIGVADMLYGMSMGVPHRASGQMALHVLEIMHTIHRASDQGQHIQLQSTCDRPAPLGQPEWKMLD